MKCWGLDHSYVDTDLVWWKAISVLYLKAAIHFVADIWSWLGLSSHSGAIVQLTHLMVS
jgi:hypothetical protein